MDYKVKDSGVRQSFESGAVRDIQQGKGRFDLITPVALERLARHYESGAVKYGDSNWTKGIPIMRLLDSAKRHLNKYLRGHRDEDHLIACAWNCFAAAHTEDMILDGVMKAELAEGLPCYIAKHKMDASTRQWWKAVNSRIRKARKKKQ